MIAYQVSAHVAAGSASPGSTITEAVGRAMGPAQEAASQAASSQQAALEGLSERIAALEAAMSEDDGGEDITAVLGERLDAMKSEMQTRLEDLSARTRTQAEAVQGALSELSGGMQEAAQMAAAAVAARAAGGGEGASAEGMTVTDRLGVGETAQFADGQVRAFVSRVDPAGGSVRLMVNGEAAALGSGGTTRVALGDGSCTVAVMGLDDGKATLGSDCGTAASGGSEEGGESEAAAAPAAPEDGHRAGEVASLADGKLRVFVSGLADDGSAARIAVNGVQTQLVNAGESVEVETGEGACTVTVTGVGNGMVGLEASCG
ncbi:hypothetical protein [Salipiger bermudensis]|uniref:hypothetical protein n=1 Tax=Salipiger bermudensis TaxID=344736 RepID=UPI003513F276